MLTQQQLDEAIEYLSGSCIMGGSLVSVALDIEGTPEEEDQLLKEMEAVGLQECSSCGWFGYPGEIYDDLGRCDQCSEYDEDDF